MRGLDSAPAVFLRSLQRGKEPAKRTDTAQQGRSVQRAMQDVPRCTEHWFATGTFEGAETMNAMMHADNCTDSDLFDEGCWLALHASLLQDAEYVQMPTSDFAKHASVIVGHLAELQRLRKAADEVLKSLYAAVPR